MTVAITRQPSDALNRCLLSHLERRPIDVALARRQHAAYEALLEELGCRVVRLPAEPQLPDSVFVEDAAVVLDEVAILTRPGAAARRPETASVAAALAPFRPLRRIAPPGTLDGGDVLRLERRLWVGRSARSDRNGAAQLRALAGEHGYEVVEVEVRGCLHLKSAVSSLGGGRLLVHPEWIDLEPFRGQSLIEVDPAEPAAANALEIGGTVIVAAEHPRTRRRLEQAGLAVRAVAASELAKAEGGLTCCSLLVAEPGPQDRGCG